MLHVKKMPNSGLWATLCICCDLDLLTLQSSHLIVVLKRAHSANMVKFWKQFSKSCAHTQMDGQFENIMPPSPL